MEPVRTCIGCRSRAPRSQLIRLVVQHDVLHVDESKSLAGRGAWVHPDASCVELADRRRAWQRALRVQIPLDSTPIKNRLNG
ncbi:MAG TPA: YlxR family protein [Microbacteriaceae bacterium]|nr:YlxR family protein [Microbacteriaceae bacterium]